MKCIAVVLCCAVALAQVSPTPNPRQSSADQSNGPGFANCCKIAVEMLTDTMGVDFGPYLKPLLQDVNQQWLLLKPEAAGRKTGKVVIQFVIRKDGMVAGLQVVESSGNVMVDRPAYGSITASNPFPPLPSEFKGPNLGLRISYYYDLSGFNISPNRVKLPLGASQQFLAAPLGPGDSVVWSIDGKGCDGKSCGTISETGVYTAPDTLPDPPLVTVTVKLKAQAIYTSSANVTIVKPEEKPSSESLGPPKH